ncbi:MAG: DHH family phosphoesterase [Nakamurella sp.]
MSAAPTYTTAAPVQQVAAQIDAARSILLLSHVNPDADTLGSAFALGLALEARGARVQVAFDAPDEVPASLTGLPGQHLITRDPADVDLVVCVDVASIARLARLAARLAGTPSIVIDHHASNPGFGDLNWVDPRAEATAAMIAALLDELDAYLTLPIATNLYAGLATDTVNFRFATPAGYRLAARLVEVGVDAADVLRPITDTHPFGWLGMLGQVLSTATLDRTAAGGLGAVIVPIPLAAAAGLRREELDAVIDIVRTSAEAEVAVVTKQTDPDTWQVSLRSHGAVVVGAVAVALGGGGHPRAAGYTFVGTHPALVTRLLAGLTRPGV